MADSSKEAAGDAAARVARLSYGRLLAVLVSRSRDIAGAEDVLAEALTRALERWPRDGIPSNPEGWIVTTAKRLRIDRGRSAKVASDAEGQLMLLDDERADGMTERSGSDGDRLLSLMFVCAHPAIDRRDRTPLMLRTVLGLDAKRIASVFLVAPGTMGQRLTRAKAKIMAAGIAFQLPEPDDYAARVTSVLDAIYAAYTLGWDNAYGDDAKTNALAQEAIWLGSLVADLLPAEGEAHGLLALMLFCEARRDARRDPASGGFVALRDQDVGRWNAALIDDAETALRNGGRVGAEAPGRYQLEAAIQAVHSARRLRGETDWNAIALLYEGLLAVAPTVGARTAAAVALREVRGAVYSLDALDAIPEDVRRSYQPWWAARAQLLVDLDRTGEARDAFARAAGLTEDPAVRTHLLKRSAALNHG